MNKGNYYGKHEETFGIQIKSCRYCTSENLLNHLNPLIVPCNCSGNAAYAHASCLKSYIINSKYSNTYQYCPLCKSKYSMPLNANFDNRRAKKIYYATLTFEFVKYILFILTITSLCILMSVIFNEYIYEYDKWFETFGFTFTTSILFVSLCLILIILNLITLKNIILIILRYKKNNFCDYTSKNYEIYIDVIKFRICDREWKSMFLVTFTLLFFPISFVLIMYILHIYQKINLLKNKYFYNVHVF